MSKFEKKFGKYAIRNLPLMLIMCYAVGYIIQFISRDFLYYLTLNPYEILHGQIWRLVTWIIVPPDFYITSWSIMDLFFTAIMLSFYYSVGVSLERTWGTYQYNVYIFRGLLITVLASFAFMGCNYLFMPQYVAMPELAKVVFMSASTVFSTYYINMSILLAFAATFPDAQILLMLIIPVKMKWMGVAYGALLVLQFVSGVGFALGNAVYRFAIGASLLNFAIFWLASRNRIHMTPKQMKHRQEFKRDVKVNAKPSKHKCAICGRTDETSEIEFRYCSKCDGNYEYCQDHLFTHEHVKK